MDIKTDYSKSYAEIQGRRTSVGDVDIGGLAVPVKCLRTPAYRLHRPSGQAVVTLSSRDFYLGRHGSPKSRAEYDRLVAEWLANGRRFPSSSHPSTDASAGPSINEVILGYIIFAEAYYTKNGVPTSEVRYIKLALRPLRQLYGPKDARELLPLFSGSGLVCSGWREDGCASSAIPFLRRCKTSSHN
jgi:hypothetical protein